MVTDYWHLSGKIDTPHLHSVSWHSTFDDNNATPIGCLHIDDDFFTSDRTLIQ